MFLWWLRTWNHWLDQIWNLGNGPGSQICSHRLVIEAAQLYNVPDHLWHARGAGAQRGWRRCFCTFTSFPNNSAQGKQGEWSHDQQFACFRPVTALRRAEEMSQLFVQKESSSLKPVTPRQAVNMTAEMRKQNTTKTKPAVYKRVTMKVCCAWVVAIGTVCSMLQLPLMCAEEIQLLLQTISKQFFF